MFLKEVSILLALAHAVEGQGCMWRAHEYDEKAKRLWSESGESLCSRFVGCDRREAVELLNAGRPRDAARALAIQPMQYAAILDHSGINLMQLDVLNPVVDALKVLVEALVQIGDADTMAEATRIRADLKETDAILAGYWEGVLEETRRELREQHRAGGPAAAGAVGEGGAEAKKKSKAAKRKQQKRKAQQQKKAAEMGGGGSSSCSSGMESG